MDARAIRHPNDPPTSRPPGRPLDRRRGRAPRRVPWPVVLLALITAAAVLIGQAAREQGTSDVPETMADAAPAPAPMRGDTNEPVAAVAKVLSRSVVQIETGAGLGSGVIYNSSGLILTAAHVVNGGGDGVTVRLPAGERLAGEVVGADDQTDVAVIDVDRQGLPAASLAVNEPVRVGQLAVAIGSPFGLEGSVTSGVVSAIDRSIMAESGASTSMIQTDASINPGNSGGALADAKGRVIGINDAIRSDSGVNSGVGFAIPIDIAVTVADALLQGEEPRFGFLGIRGTDPTSGPAGALVIEITPRSAADVAGLQEGDVITSFEETAIEGMSELASLIRSAESGTTVSLVVLREGQRIQLEAEIGTR